MIEINHIPRTEDFKSICNFIKDTEYQFSQDSLDKKFMAVMKELSEKSLELQKCISNQKDQEEIVEKLIELEQAADSALRVAQTIENPEVTRRVQESHDRVKSFKDRFLN